MVKNRTHKARGDGYLLLEEWKHVQLQTFSYVTNTFLDLKLLDLCLIPLVLKKQTTTNKSLKRLEDSTAIYF